jgi:hypothetical protein
VSSETKCCTICRQTKPLSNFYRKYKDPTKLSPDCKSEASKYSSRCKPCFCAAQRLSKRGETPGSRKRIPAHRDSVTDEWVKRRAVWNSPPICPVCNKQPRYMDRKRNYYQSTCTPCLMKQRLEAGKYLFSCNQCGKLFRDVTMRQFCSKECHKEFQRTPQSPTKVCRDCGVVRPYREFASTFLYGRRRWFSRCADCYRQYKNLSNKQYAKRHPDKVRERSRRNYTAHRDYYRNKVQEYRARLVRATVVGKIDRAAIVARDCSTCYWCQRVLPEGEITLDHMVALSRGGTHCEANLTVSCRSCNSSKGAKLLQQLTFI